ncbi:MAG: ABC transporter ATP-binding protein [Actinomycetota bacterium]
MTSGSVLEAPPGPREARPAPPGGEEHYAISIRGLSKRFGKRRGEGEQALASVDIDIFEGEFLVLLGPSGCGKTTLLRTIAGLERPDTGSIRIHDEVAFDAERRVEVAAGRRPVNMIFQSYALWPHMTAYRNVAFPLRCRGAKRSEISPRVDKILTTVGIGHLARRYPSQMSGGQQQRLALARALVVGERIVLFDEPLSNVDAQVREKLRLELIRMQRSLGFTAIYVTHDQSEAMELADRIAVMSHGRVAQLDQPRELYRNPRDIDVARFLGQSNEIPLTVGAYDAAASRLLGSGEMGTVQAIWLQRGDAAPRPGEELVAFGRPGDFAVLRASAADSETEGAGIGSNTWQGSIEAMRFVGSHTECVVKIGEIRLLCWLGSEGQEVFREDDSVSVSIAAEKLQAMRER